MTVILGSFVPALRIGVSYLSVFHLAMATDFESLHSCKGFHYRKHECRLNLGLAISKRKSS
jgi:hypothetical protein